MDIKRRPKQNAMQTLAVTPVWNLLSKAALAVSLLLLLGLGWQMLRSQARSEQELLDRFRIRAEIGSEFLTGYTKELLARESQEATAELSGQVSVQQFTRFSRALGFPAAVLFFIALCLALGVVIVQSRRLASSRAMIQGIRGAGR